MHVIYRSRGVCGEADVGNQKLLAAVVAVSGAFATATEIPMLAVKKRWHQTQKSIAFTTATQTPRLAVNKKQLQWTQEKRTPQFFLCTPILN